jgi:outer membrane receptor protein involved in Fe transport
MRFLAPQSFTLKQDFWRAWSSRFRFVALGLVIFASHAIGQTQETVLPPSVLKKLSVEELMNIEVTSVSKRPEKLSETASAIQVVTGENIKRSGAMNLADALRLAPNLEVQQIMMDLPAHFQFEVTTRYVDTLPDPHIPNYLTFDVRLAWQFKNLELSVVGQNLWDNRHPEFSVAQEIPRSI